MLTKPLIYVSLNSPSQISKRLSECVKQPTWLDRFGLSPRQYWFGKVSADGFMIYRHANALCQLHGVIRPIPHHTGSQVVVQVRLAWGQVLWLCFAVLMIGFIAYREWLFDLTLLAVVVAVVLPFAVASDVSLSIRRLKMELSVVE